jgi:NAD(P)H-dependent flavin oxidoreductase YrpB (nitropropane dioxygenase family)
MTRTGILTALTQPNPDALRKAIRQTRQLTSKPFGVNLTILPAINPPDYEGFARAAVEEGVKIIETAGSNRKLCFTCNLIVLGGYLVAIEAKPFIEYFKKNGCIIIHKCTSIKHAKVSMLF